MNDLMKFQKDGKGRVFVEKEEDIFAMRSIIREKYKIDYIPPHLITVFSDENYTSIPVDDFAYDMEPILYDAWDRGIKCFCVFGDVVSNENNRMQFPNKRYGRIYVEKDTDVLALKGIMIGMDDYEFGYLPDDLISVFKKGSLCFNKYVGKFDELDMGSVLYYAWLLSIKCFCVFSHDDDFS
jgi:hypothetical protein